VPVSFLFPNRQQLLARPGRACAAGQNNRHEKKNNAESLHKHFLIFVIIVGAPQAPLLEC
jgi:hypothetical protein